MQCLGCDAELEDYRLYCDKCKNGGNTDGSQGRANTSAASNGQGNKGESNDEE